MTVFASIPFPALYIGTFAIVLTGGLGLISYAMSERKKTDGTPFNTMLLKTVGGVSAAFWLVSIGSFVTQA